MNVFCSWMVITPVTMMSFWFFFRQYFERSTSVSSCFIGHSTELAALAIRANRDEAVRKSTTAANLKETVRLYLHRCHVTSDIRSTYVNYIEMIDKNEGFSSNSKSRLESRPGLPTSKFGSHDAGIGIKNARYTKQWNKIFRITCY